MPKVDFLIVGQGLAGSVLSYRLWKAGKRLCIVDAQHEGASSSIAAGIINPVTGRRFARSWMIEELFPVARTFYQSLAEQFGIPFFHERRIYRFLVGNRDMNEWYSRSALEGFHYYMGEVETLTEWKDRLHLPFGAGIIQPAGQVNMPQLIQCFKAFFQQEAILLSERFVVEELELHEQSVHYRDIEADQIIFCEGHQARFNPYFQYLPFEPAKGEVLTIHAPDLGFSDLIKNKLMLAPLGEDRYWSGSNYEWNPTHDRPTDLFKTKFTAQLHQTLKTNFSVEKHQAAIRPTVKDRRPILGHHPRYPQIAIFNGLGTKGASLAPYWSKEMVDYLLQKKALPTEVDIKRFATI